MQILMKPSYYGIDELKEEWSVGTSRVKHWLINGELKSHLWLPVMSVYSLAQSFNHVSEQAPDRLKHFEGLIPLTRQHCQRLFRAEQLTIRDFTSVCGTTRYQLPDSSDDICARVDDLLVLGEERERFEKKYRINSADSKSTYQVLQVDHFRSVQLNGERHYFGTMQAQALRLLYQASLNDDAWQNGKLILQQVGSESFTLSNIFKRKPIWKQLIESDGKGYYRMHPDLSAPEAWRYSQ